MPTYAIGDIQGCFAQYEALLTQIDFHPSRDTLWFTGDLVNRGPQSLEVLRHVKSLGDQHQVVLGNHDLHLLAVAYGTKQASQQDTLAAILSAPDKDELLDWLRHRPMLVQESALGYVMTHAGIAPAWTVSKAKQLAQEIEQALQGNAPEIFFKAMYGNQPDQWNDSLTGTDRLRCITNYLTRMRFCYRDGRLDLSFKGEINHQPPDLIPWFDVEPRANSEAKIIFGHWAALGGQVSKANLFALDTGCVWGNCLTAMRLEDGVRFSVGCQ